MPDFSIYGTVIEVDEVEDALLATLKAWIKPHLAYQANRRGLPVNTFEAPRAWPTVDEFDLRAHEQLPAIVIITPSTAPAPKRNERGQYRQTWPFEVRAAVAGKTERDARKLASAYLAAIKGAVVQNPTLGGKVEKTILVGPPTYIAGVTPAAGQRGAQRAIYGTTFDITVRNTVSDLAGPRTPPADPYNPPSPPGSFTDADITVTSIPVEEPL